MFAEVLRKRKERKEKIDARPSTLNSTDDDFTKINAKKSTNSSSNNSRS